MLFVVCGCGRQEYYEHVSSKNHSQSASSLHLLILMLVMKSRSSEDENILGSSQEDLNQR